VGLFGAQIHFFAYDVGLVPQYKILDLAKSFLNVSSDVYELDDNVV
jgi:hypothetical protein